MSLSLNRAAAIVSIGVASGAFAQHTIIDSELAEAYFFVDHYETVIEKTPEEVWSQLVNLPSWTGMTHEAGPERAVGEVLRLYEGEDFFLEVSQQIPSRLLMGTLQPFVIEGEESLGLLMLVLTDLGSETLVSMFWSRHFAWFQDGPNPLRERRESREYLDLNKNSQNAILARLKQIAEQ